MCSLAEERAQSVGVAARCSTRRHHPAPTTYSWQYRAASTQRSRRLTTSAAVSAIRARNVPPRYSFGDALTDNAPSASAETTSSSNLNVDTIPSLSSLAASGNRSLSPRLPAQATADASSIPVVLSSEHLHYIRREVQHPGLPGIHVGAGVRGSLKRTTRA